VGAYLIKAAVVVFVAVYIVRMLGGKWLRKRFNKWLRKPETRARMRQLGKAVAYLIIVGLEKVFGPPAAWLLWIGSVTRAWLANYRADMRYSIKDTFWTDWLIVRHVLLTISPWHSPATPPDPIPAVDPVPEEPAEVVAVAASQVMMRWSHDMQWYRECVGTYVAPAVTPRMTPEIDYEAWLAKTGPLIDAGTIRHRDAKTQAKKMYKVSDSKFARDIRQHRHKEAA
jgi:hypothetical protein